MRPKLGHGKLARHVRIKMAGAARADQLLLRDLLLQRHKGMNECLGPRRAAGDMDVNRDKPVDPFQDIVALLERPARNGTSAHGNHVFGLGHLVVQTHHLGRHFLGHRPGNDH